MRGGPQVGTWAQACFFSKIDNFFLCGKMVYFFLQDTIAKKIVNLCDSFCSNASMDLHDVPQKDLHDMTIFFVVRIYRKKRLHVSQHTRSRHTNRPIHPQHVASPFWCRHG